MSEGWILDAVLVPLGVATLAFYNINFFLRVKFHPFTTVVGVNHYHRKAWVRCIMADVEKKNILAVQTLRNSIMAATLLASTSMIIAAAIAAFVATTSKNGTTTSAASISPVLSGSQSQVLLAVKFFCIILFFVCSFMCHVQSIRYTNHVNFLINIPQGPDVPCLTVDYVSGVLARGSNFYTIGTRAFYFSFPFILWLFGPIPMLLSCLTFVPVLYYLDTASGFDAPTTRTSAELAHERDPESTSVRSKSRQSNGHAVESDPIDPRAYPD